MNSFDNMLPLARMFRLAVMHKGVSFEQHHEFKIISVYELESLKLSSLIILFLFPRDKMKS